MPLTQTSNFLVTVNSSVNFVIYCIFGEKFKRIFLKAMCVLLGKENYSPPGEIIRYPNNSFVSEAVGGGGGGTNSNNNSLYRTRSVLIHRGSLTPPGSSLLGRSNTLRVPGGRSHTGSFSHLLRLSVHSDCSGGGGSSQLPSRSSSQDCVRSVHNHLTVPCGSLQPSGHGGEGFRLRGPSELIVQTTSSRRKPATDLYYKDIPVIYTSMV